MGNITQLLRGRASTRSLPRCVLAAGICLTWAVVSGVGQELESASAEQFVETLYPILQRTQCASCHAEDGVASGSRLKFPEPTATAAEIRAFGEQLTFLVDPADPSQSLLFLKPTNRLEHSGGERIEPGGADEEALLAWVRRLARSPNTGRRVSAAADSVESKRRASVIRRLTHAQYNNTVRDLLGDLTRPAEQFPAEDFIHGYQNQTAGQSISPLLVEAYTQAAERLANNAFLRGDQYNLIPCEPASPTDAECRAEFVQSFGRRAYRRPLAAAESEKYQRLFDQRAHRDGDFLAGARAVVETMLQSPHFLFRVELGPSGPRYSFEMASRLSYLLWNTMPDAALLSVAERGGLSTADEIEATARRMLDDPRAKPAMEEFLSQWLRFDQLKSSIRDRRLFPDFSSEITSQMAEETRRLFRHLVWNNGNFMEFFSADYAFINSQLAELYELPPPSKQFGRAQLGPETGRAGVLGQAMFLTLTGRPLDTSPTVRGLYVREHFLCQNVPPPPPGVNTTLPPVSDAQPMTNRELLAVHLSNPSCASCHRLIDPIGFGFEQYDTLGRFREKHFLTIFPTRDELKKKIKTEATEYTLPIDPSGEVRGIAVENGVSTAQFSNPRELGLILASEPTCQKCVVKQLFRYTFGRSEGPDDRETLDAAFEAFRSSGFRFQALVITLVRSEQFLGGMN